MNKKDIRLIYDYDRWANRKILEMVASLSNDQYTKDQGSSFGGIHGTLVHILAADRIWLSRWLGKTPVPLKSEDIPTLDAVKKQRDIYEQELGNYLLGLTDAALGEPLQYTDFKGNTYCHPLEQQLQHKVNHATYHRGQIVSMVRQIGAEVVSTDLIQYIRTQESKK